MAQIVISNKTIDLLESITGKKFTRGGDRLINEAINILTRKIEEKND